MLTQCWETTAFQKQGWLLKKEAFRCRKDKKEVVITDRSVKPTSVLMHMERSAIQTLSVLKTSNSPLIPESISRINSLPVNSRLIMSFTFKEQSYDMIPLEPVVAIIS